MAFTSAETTKIRLYLGYPQVYRYQNPRLESAISVVGGDPDATAAAQDLLTKIDSVFTAIQGDGLDSAGIKGLDKGDVEFFEGSTLKDMKGIGRIHTNRLSMLFGVPLAHDVFGSGGYPGDGWMGENNMSYFPGF